jgi:hypothetical protein
MRLLESLHPLGGQDGAEAPGVSDAEARRDATHQTGKRALYFVRDLRKWTDMADLCASRL